MSKKTKIDELRRLLRGGHGPYIISLSDNELLTKAGKILRTIANENGIQNNKDFAVRMHAIVDYLSIDLLTKIQPIIYE